jgi:hypothetical protein
MQGLNGGFATRPWVLASVVACALPSAPQPWIHSHMVSSAPPRRR